jgi:alkanesulfonate monooxygenase SsuD/methylene tetrahydromethanopterin reductase-like flavin-dependent oxidoreductase (luciferase family)
VGRGFVAHDYEVLGVPLDESQARMNESLEIILKAWTQRPFSHHGQFFNFENVQLWPAPEQRPHPPVWLAATSNPESFAWIGRQGYRLLTIGFAVRREHLAQCTQVYRDAWSAAGHPLGGFEIGTHYQVVVGEDGAEARRTAERATARRVEYTYRARELSEARAGHGYQEFSVERLVDEGRLIAGDPDEVLAIIRRLHDEIGFTWLNSTFQFGDISFERAQQSLELFGTHVIPRFAAVDQLSPVR